MPLIQTLLKFCEQNSVALDSSDEEAENQQVEEKDKSKLKMQLNITKDQVIGLLMAPSRELAMQIMTVLK